MRRASATSSSARRRSSSEPIYRITTQAALHAWGVLSSGTQCRSLQSALSFSDAPRRSSFTGIAVRTQFAQLTPANARRVRHIFAGCPDPIDKEPSRRIQRRAGGILRPAHSFAFEAKTAKGGQGSAGTDCRRPRSRIKGTGGKCTPRRTAACKLAVITHTGSLGISPARNPASRLGYGRASADPISAGATIYSDGLVPNAIPKNGGRSAAHHGQCRSCCDGPQY
jgi:hypothetical protein